MWFTLVSITLINAACLSLFISAAVVPWVTANLTLTDKNFPAAFVGGGQPPFGVTQNFGLIQVGFTDPSKRLTTNSFWLYNTVPTYLYPLFAGITDNSNLIVNKDQLLTAFSLFVIAFVFLFWNFLVTWVGVATTREINLKLVYFVQLFSAVVSTIAMIIAGNYFQAQTLLPTNDASISFGYGCAVTGVVLVWFAVFVQYMRNFQLGVANLVQYLGCFGLLEAGLRPGLVHKANTAQLSSTTGVNQV